MSEQPMATQEQDGHSFVVQKAIPQDAEGLYEVKRRTWLDTYPNPELGITEEDIRRRVEGENGERIPEQVAFWRKGIETSGDTRQVFVAKDGYKVVGFVAPTIMDGQRRIGALYVLPETQGYGIGRQLLEKAIEWHGPNEDIFLHVASYNQNAIDFYKKNGFEETGNNVIDESARSQGLPEIPEIEMVRKPEQ